MYTPLGDMLVKSVESKVEYDVFFNLESQGTFGTLLMPVSAKYFITENISVFAGASFQQFSASGCRF
ncbi:hypothetical protein [Chryseobacterium sp.]|uniref:hypothetical protein n=1 Tax=Chryseobacterium sp. TaxID=1871047 RepID=UPI00388D7CE1